MPKTPLQVVLGSGYLHVEAVEYARYAEWDGLRIADLGAPKSRKFDFSYTLDRMPLRPWR